MGHFAVQDGQTLLFSPTAEDAGRTPPWEADTLR